MPIAVAPVARRTAIALVPMAALAACSTGGQPLTRTGFLSDYSQMRPTKEHGKASIYVAPDYDPATYAKVIVDRPGAGHAAAFHNARKR